MVIQMPAPLPIHKQWWVVKTRGGYRAIDHQPRARGQAIGPFVGPLTAEAKIAELTLADRRRRVIARVAAIASFTAAAAAAANLIS